ncbi:ABC transporter permease [Alicyclobacillus sp. SO9]|uniref:ABC transporter permease n=1 Tax=Alicyclobacillus sp. SO9 TaxID=2665646 RepID=UPI0018E85A39|nr:ABC transporter permease [Alicyclobacillus sp. SO9]QQE79283.1 ABC transporter permease [Alicyclobacillus sp. SO9]
MKYFLLEFKLFARIPFAFLFSLAFPLLLLFIFASAYGNKPTAQLGNIGTVNYYIPVTFAATAIANGIIATSVALAGNRSRKIYIRYKLIGFSPLLIMFTQILVYFCVTFLSSLLILAIAKMIYGVSIPDFGHLMLFSLFYLMGFLSMISIGLLLGTFSNDERSALSVSLIVFFLFDLLGGILIPVEKMQGVMTTLSHWIPAKSFIQGLNYYWNGTSQVTQFDVYYLLAVFIVCTGVASLKFRWK